MTEDQAKALFLLAGIEVERLYRLENQYWPESYVELRQKSPWWLAITKLGEIKMGWRKNVISINWEATPIRGIVTEDDVTKENHMVHAWSYVKALQYLTQLSVLMSKHEVGTR
jgi:hypothetical protein